jgi:hypothetical protein
MEMDSEQTVLLNKMCLKALIKTPDTHKQARHCFSIANALIME